MLSFRSALFAAAMAGGGPPPAGVSFGDPFYVSHSTFASTSATSAAVPAGTTENDILVLFVRTAAQTFSAPSGYNALASEVTGTPGDADAVGLYVFWKRASSSESSVTIADVGVQTGALVCYRGCILAGSPFDVIAGDVETSASTSVTFPGVTTTHDNCLILNVCAHEVATSSTVVSAAANGNLLHISRDVNHQAANTNGGGVAISHGLLRDPGSSGASTATATATRQARMTIALKGQDIPAMVDVGAPASGTGAIAPALPTGWREDDVFVLAVETANQPISAPAGWTEVSASPQGTGTAGGTAATCLQVFWRRAVSGDAAPSLADSGDHTIGQIVAIAGCPTGSSPIDAVVGDVEASSTTAVTWPEVTSTTDKCLVLSILAYGYDNVSPQLGTSFAATGTTDQRKLFDSSAVSSNGGAVAMYATHKASAGACGSPTATMSNPFAQGRISLALKRG